MEENKLTRRYFLQAIGTLGALATLPVLASYNTPSEKPGNITIKQLDDDYIIVDGWVLLKSDLTP